MRGFKGFKKIKADQDYTTFKHESNGSELKVAHKGLSQKMRHQVDSLPVHLADGDPDGQVPDALKANDDSSQSGSGHAPISININASPAQPSPTAVPTSVDPTPQSTPQMKDENGGVQNPQAQSPGLGSQIGPAVMQGLAKLGSFGVQNVDGSGAQGASPQASMPSQPAGQMAGDSGALPPPDPNAAPPDQAAPPTDQTQPPVAAAATAPQLNYQQQKHQEMAQEMTSFQHDLDQGFIKPETYQSLFHDKSTLGKIGTIFGLMLSGAGSGLSHQSNALMDMMNKQISNDLDAQKSTASNRMNFHQLANQAVLQNAQANHLNTENSIQANNYEFMMAQRVVAHDLAQRVAAMPEGSAQKQQGQLTLANMAQAMNNGQFNMMDVASANMARMNQLTGMTGGSNSPDDQVSSRINALRYLNPEMAKDLEERYVPGVGVSQVKIPDSVRQEIVSKQKLLNTGNDLLDYSKSHSNIVPGTPEYRYGVTKAAAFQQEVREGMLGTVFRESEKPLLKDFVSENPSGALKMFSTQPKLRAILDNTKMGLNTVKQTYGLPTNESSSAPRGTSNQASQQNEIRYDAQGNGYRRGPDGKAMRINQTASK